MQPSVDIIIPAYNAGHYLRESVRAAMAQTYDSLRVLIVDDGSTDGSVEELQRIDDARLAIIRQEHAGKSVALNNALAHSSADFYAIQDADDLSHPQRIERQIQAMQQHPHAAAVFAGHDLILNGRRVAPLARWKSAEHVRADIEAFRLPAHDPTALFRLSMTRDLLYDPKLRIGQGYDYILRLGEQRPMLVLGECLYSYRIHDRSHTQQRVDRRVESVLRLIGAACSRRGIDEVHTQRVLAPFARRLRQYAALNNVAAHFLESVLDQREHARPSDAVRTACTCAGLRPFDLHYYRPLLYAFAPLFAVDLWRRRRLRRASFTLKSITTSPHNGRDSHIEPKSEGAIGSTMMPFMHEAQNHV